MEKSECVICGQDEHHEEGANALAHEILKLAGINTELIVAVCYDCLSGYNDEYDTFPFVSARFARELAALLGVSFVPEHVGAEEESSTKLIKPKISEDDVAELLHLAESLIEAFDAGGGAFDVIKDTRQFLDYLKWTAVRKENGRHKLAQKLKKL